MHHAERPIMGQNNQACPVKANRKVIPAKMLTKRQPSSLIGTKKLASMNAPFNALPIG
jgi:hypothetical protein